MFDGAFIFCGVEDNRRITDTNVVMNIYFSGIGGVGIGPLAMLSQDAGHNVFGSDTVASPMFNDLGKRGVGVSLDQTGKFLDNVNQSNELDLFVYTAALPPNHPELKYAREYAITSVKRHELINRLIEYKDMKLIAVSGTHGKTTTTGMFIWAFKELNIPASYSVGTRLSFGPAAKYDNKSEYFIYEADEFDRNMLKFKPYLAVIPSLDYDHPDTYKTKDAYKEAFEQFVQQSEAAVVWKEVQIKLPNVALVKNINKLITLPGKHNKINASLVLSAVHELLPNTPQADIVKALNSFPGTERRFEKLARNLYTDYAHHPVEIASTIRMAKELNENVVVVYQPHQNIRQHQLVSVGGYKDSFHGAKKVYWLPTYLSREDEALNTLKPSELIKTTADSSSMETAKMDEKLAKKLLAHIKDDDLVVGMSAGDLDEWLRQLADKI